MDLSPLLGERVGVRESAAERIRTEEVSGARPHPNPLPQGEGGTKERFGVVAGYIMGNEVNSHWWWSNMGRVSMEEFADDYLRVMRTGHDAVRRQSSWAGLSR